MKVRDRRETFIENLYNNYYDYSGIDESWLKYLRIILLEKSKYIN